VNLSRGIAPLLAAALAACTPGAAVRATGVSTAPAPAAAQAPAAAPPVRMFAGTDAVPGVRSLWCVAQDCSRARGAYPKRFLDGVGSGLLLFTTGVVPEEAALEVETLSGKPVRRLTLQPGTTMAARIDLGRGRFVLTLVERWDDREARWLFGLRGPSGSR
jgi:hypothetical protein